MKIGQMVYDADNPKRTGELLSIGEALGIIATADGDRRIPLARLRQGNGHGLAARRTVRKKIAEAKRYQPMSARSRKELRALVEKEQYDKFPSNWLQSRVLRLLDDIDHLHEKLKEAKG